MAPPGTAPSPRPAGGAWVLLASCGCPRGACSAAEHPAADDAWLALCRTWRGAMKAMRRGGRIELADRADPGFARLLARIGAPCPHQGNDKAPEEA